MSAKNIQKISDIFTNIVKNIEEKENEEKVTFEQLLKSLGNRSFGPMLLIPGLLAAFPPIGGIPGMSIITGTWIILVAVQLLFFKEYLWMPKKFKEIEFDRESFKSKTKKLIPYIKKLEFLFRPRWKFFSSSPFAQIVALECIILAVSMYPLAFIPFGVTLPAISIIFLAAGLTMKDGFVTVLGNLSFAGSIWLSFYFLKKL